MDENELSRLIIGCAIEVHRELGPGLLESVYERCLTHELLKTGVGLSIQHAVPVVYKNEHLDLGFRLDIWVDRKVVVEVKAVEELNDVHLAQLLTYLRLTGSKLGLLINFNVPRLKEGIRRVVHGL